ncbi:PH domain-containing protein [Natronomonas sp. EA1]|uniref:PH domain-containing protein n=1 Tax=Natronomonas sp. EA1 TaxID=3421655 RepID=UPI003EBA6976
MSDDVQPAIRRVDEPATDASATDEPVLDDEAAEPPSPPEPSGVERQLDPRVRYEWLIRAGISSLVLAVVGTIIGNFTVGLWLGPALGVLVLVSGVGLVGARYRAWRYTVRADSLLLSRGVITQTRTVVPYVRLQHVDVSRGPIERSLGLASVVVYTAGSRGADVTIPGLTPGDADSLQSRLKALAIAAEGEDAV